MLKLAIGIVIGVAFAPFFVNAFNVVKTATVNLINKFRG